MEYTIAMVMRGNNQEIYVISDNKIITCVKPVLYKYENIVTIKEFMSSSTSVRIMRAEDHYPIWADLVDCFEIICTTDISLKPHDILILTEKEIFERYE